MVGPGVVEPLNDINAEAPAPIENAALSGKENSAGLPHRLIVAAAIRQKNLVYSVKRPGRHHNVMREMAAAGIPIPIVGEQGFLTSDGLFVGRFEAKDIAHAAGQIIKKTGPADELFSEDVW